jgi:hypothetical protein
MPLLARVTKFLNDGEAARAMSREVFEMAMA